MSVWTHVAGVVRIDGFSVHDKEISAAINVKLGSIVYFDSPDTVWNDACCDKIKTPPMGSEGSLQYEYCISGAASQLARGQITIWGDLRDFGRSDCTIIKDWLNALVPKDDDDYDIRQGLVLVNVEGHRPFVIEYYNQTNLFVERYHD